MTYTVSSGMLNSTIPYHGRFKSNGTSVIKEIRLRNLNHRVRLSRSFKVIGTDTDRSVIYDFLLTFHSNDGPISYRFQDKGRF